MGPDRGQLEQVVEAEDAEAAGPFEQRMQEVARGQGVGQGPVGRAVGEPQPLGQGAQLAVGHLVAHQPAGQGAGVDPSVGQRRAAGGGHRRLEKAQVEPHVVADDHCRAEELEEGGQHGLDPRRRQHHGLGDAG